MFTQVIKVRRLFQFKKNYDLSLPRIRELVPDNETHFKMKSKL